MKIVKGADGDKSIRFEFEAEQTWSKTEKYLVFMTLFIIAANVSKSEVGQTIYAVNTVLWGLLLAISAYGDFREWLKPK